MARGLGVHRCALLRDDGTVNRDAPGWSGWLIMSLVALSTLFWVIVLVVLISALVKWLADFI